MTPEEKADSLLELFQQICDDYGTPEPDLCGKSCAILCVNEILSLLPDPPGSVSGGKKEFYQEVKEHLLNQ